MKDNKNLDYCVSEDSCVECLLENIKWNIID